MSIGIVRLQERTVREKSKAYLVTAPKSLVEQLGWKKGETLLVKIVEIEVNGVKKKGLFYYKP